MFTFINDYDLFFFFLLNLFSRAYEWVLYLFINWHFGTKQKYCSVYSYLSKFSSGKKFTYFLLSSFIIYGCRSYVSLRIHEIQWHQSSQPSHLKHVEWKCNKILCWSWRMKKKIQKIIFIRSIWEDHTVMMMLTLLIYYYGA